ncbi:NFACT family protein [Chloracidobacterium validum]|uniref:NFACT family protein n=1 Tax=Chloracidobacterium validum TaxID=2821543 RepID=A0ABX8BDJ9_9BACT|nr:NFACT family protein [Chloracidobacterium validum]QUW03734.1 NFACT family protein [Chloracidobacterium validum]
MDAFLLSALVTELNDAVARHDQGLLVGKIAVVGQAAIGLDMRRRDGRWLVLVARPHDSAFYSMSRHPGAADAVGEPPFVARLRKALRGARLVGATKTQTERSVTLTFHGFDDAEQPTRWLLRHDLTGHSANLWLLTADECIVDALRPWDGRPGERYQMPRQARHTLTWSDVTPERLPGTSDALETFLRDVVCGCHPRLAREVAFRARSRPPWTAFSEVYQSLVSPQAFFLYALPEGLEVFPLRLTHVPELVPTPFVSAHEAVEARFERRAAQAALAARRRRWQQALGTWRRRIERALDRLDATTRQAQDADRWRRWGELLYANMATAKRTGPGVEVMDYYADEPTPLTIPLESESEDLAAAAQRYFRRYQRAQRALTANAERRTELEAVQATVMRLDTELAQATQVGELDACIVKLREQMPFELQPQEEPLENRTDRARTGEKGGWAGLRRYRGPEGYEIVVGRTSRDNDRLTFELARSHDLWLHAADYPGAHVVIRNPQRKVVPPQVVMAAAELAAYFSQAKQADRVEVRVAERRHVSRPRKGAPGQALVRESRTVTALPREVLPRIA